MIDEPKLSRKYSVEQVMSAKRKARDRLVDAVYAADKDSLELAAEFVKAALRGTRPIPRPRRYKDLGLDD
ncbi:hypothetical protein [Pseudomonas veronii]